MLSSSAAMQAMPARWWLGWLAGANDNATPPGPRVKCGTQPAYAKACGEALDECQVHAADEFRVPRGQLVKRAVTQPDSASLIMPGLEAVRAQYSLRRHILRRRRPFAWTQWLSLRGRRPCGGAVPAGAPSGDRCT